MPTLPASLAAKIAIHTAAILPFRHCFSSLIEGKVSLKHTAAILPLRHCFSSLIEGKVSLGLFYYFWLERMLWYVTDWAIITGGMSVVH